LRSRHLGGLFNIRRKSRQVFTLIEFLAVSANDYDVCRIALRQQKAALYAFHERNG
jgi:hypothetical protein